MAFAEKNQRSKSPYLTVIEAADYLGLSKHTLNNMRSRGGGPAYRKHGNLVFYHSDDLISYSNRRRFTSTGGSVG